ncbi:uncharacterized protein I303_107057 [Kwoniella dejecticola CBS 10117]|uniref:Uncharacterized protein n=1 Tax=Kwoniella dejecticola CBS 10117 TaxID=1296121 RepID=A0A1A5ZYL6_9TREE|nr:uncharacterized protein I303_06457 [Kwoniella dejecticola CBS 10117]OBR82900.1 hypothetical protein I303_06457 [Kwoniella dejecticola CBS 10117]
MSAPETCTVIASNRRLRANDLKLNISNLCQDGYYGYSTYFTFKVDSVDVTGSGDVQALSESLTNSGLSIASRATPLPTGLYRLDCERGRRSFACSSQVHAQIHDLIGRQETEGALTGEFQSWCEDFELPATSSGPETVTMYIQAQPSLTGLGPFFNISSVECRPLSSDAKDQRTSQTNVEFLTGALCGKLWTIDDIGQDDTQYFALSELNGSDLRKTSNMRYCFRVDEGLKRGIITTLQRSHGHETDESSLQGTIIWSS